MDDAELDRELKAALSVSPSPQFVPMVRAKIAQQGRPPVFLYWLKPVAVAVCLGAVGIVITYRATPGETPYSPATISSRQMTAVGPPPHVATSLTVVSRPASRSLGSSTPAPKMLPEVIIASDSRDALIQLIEGVRERRFEATFDETPASTPWAMSELFVAPLTIEPLTRPAADNN